MAGLADLAETVAAIFERVLDVEQVGANDDFFALGGDEMAALKALRLLDDALDLRLELATFVQSPTVSALASRLEHSDSGVIRSGSPGVAPVAFSQEGMLWQEHFVPGSQNLPPLVRRFQGPLDVAALEAALHEIMRRHEPLRSRFERREGWPVQVVDVHDPVPLPVRDLGALDPAAQEAALAAALVHARRPFDLAAGPLFEPTLFRFRADDHVVVFRVHHSVYDDWSVSVFRRELSALYAAFAAGEPSPLPELALGFADFCRRQRRRLAGPAGTAQLRWWKSYLAGAPFCLQLPIDDPGRLEGSPQHSAQPVTVELPSELNSRVRALARRQRATPFMTMLAAFSVLVHRYTGEPDLLMASVVANRNRPELEPMIGCFTKKILLRQDLAGDPTFVEVLDRTRVSVLGALPNQDLPFETVLQETVGPAAAAHGLVPYVGVMFQGVTPQVDEVVLPGVTTTGYDTSATTTRAHFAASDGSEGSGADGPNVEEPWGGGLYLGTFLILSLVEGPEAASLVARGAFDRPAVQRLLANFVTLLGDIVDDPTRRASELRVVVDDQPRQLTQMRNLASGEDGNVASGEDRGGTHGRCGHQMFVDQAERTPSRVAVRSGAGDLTYAALRGRVDALAARLAGAGAGRGSLVGMCLEPSEHCVVVALAIWTAGAGFVALDAADDVDHLAFVIDDASVDLVVTLPGLASHLPGSVRLIDVDPLGDADAAGDVDVDALGRESSGPEPRSEGRSGPVPRSEGRSGPGDTALVFYGSASSAVAQGVIVEHRSVVNLGVAMGADVYGPSSTGLRVCLSAPPTDDAFVRQLTAVLHGHTLHVGDGGAYRARHVVSLVEAGAVDVVDGAPGDFEALVDAGLQQALVVRPAESATPIIVVGAREGPDRRLFRSLQRMRGAGVRVLYGPPECGFGATSLGLGEAGVGFPGAGERATVGRPLVGVSTWVLGPGGSPAPVQVTGELHVGGEGLARGYAGARDLIDDRLATRSVAGGPAVRLYRTGQRARCLPDGTIELLGAVADVVPFRGFSVDRARLEATLVRSPGVREALVVVEEDTDGAPRLVADLALEAGAVLTLAQLRVWLWSQRPGCAWPAAVVTVTEPSPTAGTGQLADAPVAGSTGGVAAVEAVASLTALWAEVAGVERVDPAENYWQSFPFLEVLTRAAEAGLGIPSRMVTRNRTVATLGADLARSQR